MDALTILVTGINGYIGSHIALQLLQKGHHIRGTSRSSSTESHLLNGAFKEYSSQYTHHIVPDITAPGAFDTAANGTNAIIHVASPIDFTLTSVESFFGPAAGGITSILESARKAGPQLRSVVMTSSIAAVTDRFKHPADHIYTVNDWNTSGEAIARNQFHVGIAYAASKAIAERTFWDWRDANHPAFAMSAVNPGLVMGPPVVWPETAMKLNESLAPVWKVYSGVKTMPAGLGKDTVVDVRNVAALHVWCAEHPDLADGNRYIAVSGKMPPQAIADLLRKEFPDRGIVVGSPGEGYTPGTYEFPPGDGGVVADAMYDILGKETIIDPERMILDTVEAFEKRWPGLAGTLC